MGRTKESLMEQAEQSAEAKLKHIMIKDYGYTEHQLNRPEVLEYVKDSSLYQELFDSELTKIMKENVY